MYDVNAYYIHQLLSDTIEYDTDKDKYIFDNDLNIINVSYINRLFIKWSKVKLNTRDILLLTEHVFVYLTLLEYMEDTEDGDIFSLLSESLSYNRCLDQLDLVERVSLEVRHVLYKQLLFHTGAQVLPIVWLDENTVYVALI